MPELPEVETIRRGLLPRLKNKILQHIVVTETRLRKPLQEQDLRRHLQGRRMIDIRRRGKYLIFLWDNNAAMLLHLGMSGRLGYYRRQTDAEPHTHVIFTFQRGEQLHFRDPRRFGFICCYRADDWQQCRPLKQLGVEPLSRFFRTKYLMQHLQKSKRPIKNALMDNRIVVGLGNIYANEALFHAGIHPQRACDSLNEVETERLRLSAIQVLRRALHQGGTTLNDFRDTQGEPGFFQAELTVYGRAGESCRRCGAKIERLVLAGRSTFVCPGCQR
ncbi:bifunctional DNA-formamidopyrimidine glycosylase/DNA-(apurinic or apyrimidinic site) lyase [candidate division KSB1 bacterium]|nr:bifunctional DNA-formamidopyrimidine glycosylase/DNA-(apurinic or apyrimidinic site) lyase [candidate division KSB1 bacterium]